MLQPNCVLRSNAPPLQDGSDGLHQASRVLQEHSGNRQQQQHHDQSSASVDWNESKYLYEPTQKYPANVLAGENAYARYHVLSQPHQHQTVHHPQSQHRQPWRYGYERGVYDELDIARREAKIQYDAEKLYQRFRQSEQYKKYRERQGKVEKSAGEQKWPDHLERAFFRALITYPPMGRRKQLHKEKQRGRNELIADCIQELTGELRGRKQVSSHIQVLKPFVESDPTIMKWLSKHDMAAQSGRYHGHSYPTGRRMSNYPVHAPPQSMRSSMPSLPRTDAYGVQQLKQSLHAFEPSDFQMFIQRKYQEAGKEEVDRLHTYSEAVPQPLADDHMMSDWQTLARDFPQLASAHAKQPLDCTVLIAEASLAFPTEPIEKWKDREGAEIELGIHFQCRSRHLPATRTGMKSQSQVSLLNKFFHRGVEVGDYSESTELYFHHVHDGSTAVETEIKFGSKFWAKTLSQVGSRLRDPLELTPQQRDDVRDYVRSLSALQQVFVAGGDRGGAERIMVIHWNFRLSGSDCGRASWRRLLLPDYSSAVTGIYTAPAPPPPPTKTERADSFYDYTSSLPDLTGGSGSQHNHPPIPTLQSPFEYDASSSGASGSALSSATWPTTTDGTDSFGAAGGDNNAFDFTTGHIHLAYDDPAAFAAAGFDTTFDSTAFSFDDAAGAAGGGGLDDVDFAADPALQDFAAAQGASWYDGGAGGFVDDGTAGTGAAHGLGVSVGVDVDGHAAFNMGAGYVDDVGGGGDVGQLYGDYGGAAAAGSHYDGQGVYEQPPSLQQHRNAQAYGGAGQELMKDEDALAALADASWVRSLGTK